MSLTRHSLPRLALDGALVALAYWLAFELRFDNGPQGRYEKLFERTFWWVLGGSLVVLPLSRVYQRRWRYSGQRDYEAVARAVVAIVAAHSGRQWRLCAPCRFPICSPIVRRAPVKPPAAAPARPRSSCPTG